MLGLVERAGGTARSDARNPPDAAASGNNQAPSDHRRRLGLVHMDFWSDIRCSRNVTPSGFESVAGSESGSVFPILLVDVGGVAVLASGSFFLVVEGDTAPRLLNVCAVQIEHEACAARRKQTFNKIVTRFRLIDESR